MQTVNNRLSLFQRSHLNMPQRDHIDDTWAPFFRENVLDRLPMDKIKALYCSNNGAPTKELYAIVGALILQQMFSLTDIETCNHFLYNNLWIEALNLGGQTDRNLYISPRTLWDHSKKMLDSGLMEDIFNAVTIHLAKSNNVDLRLQRLDSVHICTNMAKLTRAQLFHRTAKIFLRDLRKRQIGLFQTVDQEIRDRYLSEDKTNENSPYNFFGQTKPGERGKNLLTMAKDIHSLITMFEDSSKVRKLESYGLLVRLFKDQCEVKETTRSIQITVKEPKDVPSSSLQNPSDPGVTFSGHKGQGRHVQVMETHAKSKTKPGDNNLSLVTAVIVEGAHQYDGKALIPVIEKSEKNNLAPEKLLADTSYGSDKNVQAALEKGIELISPVGGSDPEVSKHRVSDFLNGENGEEVICPLGQKPLEIHETKSGSTVCTFSKRKCGRCPDKIICPVVSSGKNFELKFTPKALRLSRRRAKESTDEYKRQYSMRSGIEATNSCADRKFGIKDLPYRGDPRANMSTFSKFIGLNFHRVLIYSKKKEKQCAKFMA